MNYLQQSFSVRFDYKVFFTTHLFSNQNSLFHDFLQSQKSEVNKKLLFVLDEGVVQHHPQLKQEIRDYFDKEE